MGECAALWRAPSGIMAPELFARLRELEINPRTGHKLGCTEDGQ